MSAADLSFHTPCFGEGSAACPGWALDDVHAARRLEAAALEEVGRPERELPSTVNPRHLRHTGWGLIVPQASKETRCRALKPLLDRRRRQAGTRFKILIPQTGNPERFLADLGEHLGTLKPSKVPYYLLIAAHPAEISFDFQYHLGLSHAVGRLTFDEPADYRRYAEALVETESRAQRRRRPRHVGLFSVENDLATEILGRHLTDPVIRRLEQDFSHWQLSVRRRGRATREALEGWLRPVDESARDRPGLVLASSHGGRLPPGNGAQQRLQGSIVCEPDVEHPERKILFGADQLQPSTDRLDGTIVFLFGCYGAGLPVLDSFPHADSKMDLSKVLAAEPKTLTPEPFVAALPKALLLQGAGAVVGHIDRGWTSSYLWSPRDRPAVETTDSLLDCLSLLLRGNRLGHALAPLRRRHSQLGAKLAQMLDVVRQGHPMRDGALDLRRLGLYWIGVNDARNLVVIGDPAVFVPGRALPGTSVELNRNLYRRLQRRADSQNLTKEEWIDRALTFSKGKRLV